MSIGFQALDQFTVWFASFGLICSPYFSLHIKRYETNASDEQKTDPKAGSTRFMKEGSCYSQYYEGKSSIFFDLTKSCQL